MMWRLNKKMRRTLLAPVVMMLMLLFIPILIVLMLPCMILTIPYEVGLWIINHVIVKLYNSIDNGKNN